MNSLNKKFKLYSLKEFIILTKDNNENSLIIKRNPIKIFEKPTNQIKFDLEKQSYKIFEKIIGIVKINKIDFLFLLENSIPLYEIADKEISLIKNIKILNIKILNFEDKKNLKDSLPRLNGIKKLLEKGFYFSDFYDLYKNLSYQIHYLNNKNKTKIFEQNKEEEEEKDEKHESNLINKNINKSSLILSVSFKLIEIEEKKQTIDYEINQINEKNSENLSIEEEEKENNYSDFEEYYKNLVNNDDFKFIWNTNALNYFKSFKINKNWFCFIIQGFIKCLNIRILNEYDDFDYIIISKRSFKKGGTRYNCRGANKEGYTSNYVETEEILLYKDQIYSITQIRGSIPFIWNQKPGNKFLKIEKDFNKNQEIFTKHYEMIKKCYDYILTINLLSNKKDDELKLTNNFLNYHKNVENGKLKMQCFDYHGNNKKGKSENLNYHLLENFEKIIMNGEIKPLNKLNALNHNIIQNLIIRTNCLDCLDRTNAYQNKVSLFLIAFFINDLLQSKNVIKIYKELMKISDNKEKIKISFLENKDPTYLFNFIKLFSNIWADNGDILSYSYTGTGATTSMVTRQGKKNFKSILDHSFKTVSRFYLNLFEDDEKQRDINCFLNQKIINSDNNSKIKVKTISFVLKGNKSNSFSFNSWSDLFLDELNFDLFILCYQRYDNEKFNLEIDNENISFNDFNSMIIFILKKIYKKYKKKNFILYKDSINKSGIVVISAIKDINFKVTQKIKKIKKFFEFGSMIINVAFVFNNFYFSIYNVDFSSKVNFDTKINKIKKLIQKINTKKDNYFCIFSGYFNFNINYQKIKLKKNGNHLYKNLLCKKLDVEEILKLSNYDELANKYNDLLIEGILNFYPNSFYINNSDEFMKDVDLLPKWCERILFYFNKKNMNVVNDILKIIDYNLIESFNKGNYRGVYTSFEIEIT